MVISKKNVLYTIGLILAFLVGGAVMALVNKNRVELEEEELEYMEEEPEVADDLQYFLPNKDGYIYITNENYLNKLFSYNYSEIYVSYGDFRQDALYGKRNLDYLTRQYSHNLDSIVDFYYYQEKFKLDHRILDYYKSKGLEEFMKKYVKIYNGELLLSDALESEDEGYNTILTIAYCLWRHGYMYEEGCFKPRGFYFDKRLRGYHNEPTTIGKALTDPDWFGE